jgi:hypothetical protein
MPFDRGDRTYFVSDERLRAFRALPVESKLRWIEELAMFLRMAQPVSPRRADEAAGRYPPHVK